MHCTICTICTLEGESAESAKQKNDIRKVRILRNLTFLNANFYRTGIASRATKEEDVAFIYRELPRKKNRLASLAKRNERDNIHDEDEVKFWMTSGKMNDAYLTSCHWRV